MSPTHPFAQLVSPEQVRQAIAKSERLSRVRGRVYRPLDKPLIPLREAPRVGAAGLCIAP